MSFPCQYTQYRDIVRQFIKGTNGFSGAFAQCLCGSPNLYQVSTVSVHCVRSLKLIFVCLVQCLHKFVVADCWTR